MTVGTHYKRGTWRYRCDTCGAIYKSDYSRLQWDGLRVCPTCFDYRHPQELLRAPRPPQPIPWSRPDIIPDYLNWNHTGDVDSKAIDRVGMDSMVKRDMTVGNVSPNSASYVVPVFWDATNQTNYPANQFILTNSNLTARGNAAGDAEILATVSRATGKYYCEILMNAKDTGTSSPAMGITTNKNAYPGAAQAYYLRANGYSYLNGSIVNQGITWTNGDTCGIAVDLTLGRLWLSHNNTWVGGGNPATNASPIATGLSWALFPTMSSATNTVATCTIHPSASSFVYAVPTGFLPWQS